MRPNKRTFPQPVKVHGLGEVGSSQYYYGGMRKFFKIRGDKFVENLQGHVGRGIRLDIIKFDDWLHQQHGNYEDEQGLSMRGLIAKEYGEDAAVFARSLL